MGCILTTATNQAILRSANIPQYSNVTLAGWFKITSGAKAAAVVQYICGLGSSGFSGLLVDSSGRLSYRRLNSANSILVVSASWNEGDWYYGAVTGTSGNSQSAYIWNSSGTRIGLNDSGEANTPTWTAMAVGNRYDTGVGVAGRFAYWKTWDRKLTQAEIEAEMFEPDYVDATDANTGFADSATDIGPNGRDWTLTGTSTDSDTPPVNLSSPLYVPRRLVSGTAGLFQWARRC
jgi:hypothetical protein